jgi:hypothetical protein
LAAAVVAVAHKYLLTMKVAVAVVPVDIYRLLFLLLDKLYIQ